MLRPSDLLALISLISGGLVFATAMITHSDGTRVPFMAGASMAVLIGGMIAMAYLPAVDEVSPAKRHRSKGVDLHNGLTMVGLGFSAGYLPCAVLLVVWARQWALLLPLLMGVVGFVLSVASRHERRVVEPSEPLPTPKLVGMPAETRLPAGWIPVYVHRPDRGHRDMLVDYRVYVDGARVGESAPGQTLLIGLTPGPHTIQGRSLGGSGPVLRLYLNAGEPVSLVLEANGGLWAALTRMSSKNGRLGLVRREQPGAGFENGARGSYP